MTEIESSVLGINPLLQSMSVSRPGQLTPKAKKLYQVIKSRDHRELREFEGAPPTEANVQRSMAYVARREPSDSRIYADAIKNAAISAAWTAI